MFTPQIFYCNVEECKHVVALKEQIKQLELENKRLKEDEKSLLNVIDDLQKTKNEWQEKYGDLGQDFDQLKGIIKKYEECNKYLVEENGKTYTRLEYKLLKTLVEIKEIVKQGVKIHDDIIVSNQILQKISEVVND